MKVLEGEIFQLAAKLTHSEPVRNRRVNIHRLLRDTPAFFGNEKLERAHVVEAIGQLNQDYSHVVDHRQQHLANVFRLLFFPRNAADMRDFGEAFDEVGNLFAKVVPNRVRIGQRVFDDIMQKTSRNRNCVEAHVSQNVCYFQRMDQIGFARRALLAAMLARRKQIGASQQVQVGLRMVAADFFDNFFDANHKKTEVRDQGSEVRTKWRLTSDL